MAATTLDQKKNFSLALSTTNLGIADTSWTLTAGQGAELPDTANGEFYAVIWDQTDSPDNPYRSGAGFEIVRVVTRATDTISSMTRAQQGTSAIALNTGPSYAISAVTTAADWDNVRAMNNYCNHEIIECIYHTRCGRHGYKFTFVTG
jgi:hypothetical protein